MTIISAGTQILLFERHLKKNQTTGRISAKHNDKRLASRIQNSRKQITQFKRWANYLNKHFIKEGIRMATKHTKNAQHHLRNKEKDSMWKSLSISDKVKQTLTRRPINPMPQHLLK